MKQYQVIITEILQQSIWVRAESQQDAENLKEITFCAEEAKRQCQRER